MNSPDTIYLDRGNGYLRLKIGSVKVRWTASMGRQEFIIETQDGNARTVALEEIEAAFAGLTQTVNGNETGSHT